MNAHQVFLKRFKNFFKSVTLRYGVVPVVGVMIWTFVPFSFAFSDQIPVDDHQLEVNYQCSALPDDKGSWSELERTEIIFHNTDDRFVLVSSRLTMHRDASASDEISLEKYYRLVLSPFQRVDVSCSDIMWIFDLLPQRSDDGSWEIRGRFISDIPEVVDWEMTRERVIL